MTEILTVKNMDVQHIPAFGQMLADMVAEAPRNYSVSYDFLREYGTSERFLDGMAKSILANKSGRFVAEDGDGTCIAGVETFIREDVIRIGNMYVAPDFRESGLGRKLLQACESRASQDGFTQTSLVIGSENHVARALYSSIGYKDLDPPMHEPWDLHPGVYGILLLKTLAPELDRASK